jgi:hypothetical protein
MRRTEWGYGGRIEKAEAKHLSHTFGHEEKTYGKNLH